MSQMGSGGKGLSRFRFNFRRYMGTLVWRGQRRFRDQKARDFAGAVRCFYGHDRAQSNILEVARSFRSNEWRMWQDVLLPFAVPYIIAGIRLAIGRGLIGMIIAEFYTTISDLGFMITRYANVFEMDKVFVPVIVLMFLGVSLTTMLKWVGKRIAPWSNANR
jgi:ABC-type nitrate/sulfonate/bicarbonate transport system permease component